MQEIDDDRKQHRPVIEMLEERLKTCTQSFLAEQIGVSPQYLSEILNHKKPPSDKVIDFLGLEKVVTYQKRTRRR